MSDYTAQNIERFNKAAASYDSPTKLARAKQCADAFLAIDEVKWNPQSTVVLDFACGTGIPSKF
jgi:ubiquinone/menaquinone biosynthesis C-methylase UbiE